MCNEYETCTWLYWVENHRKMEDLHSHRNMETYIDLSTEQSRCWWKGRSKHHMKRFSQLLPVNSYQ